MSPEMSLKEKIARKTIYYTAAGFSAGAGLYYAFSGGDAPLIIIPFTIAGSFYGLGKSVDDIPLK